MPRVSDPTNKAFFGSDRYFESNGQWYFSTRETVEQGPYITRETATTELISYLKAQVGIDISKTDTWDEPGAAR